MRIRKDVKKRLLDLDFVKRQSESDIVLYLIKYYENNPFRKSVGGKNRRGHGKNK